MRTGAAAGKLAVGAVALSLALLLAADAAFRILDHLYPPDLSRLSRLSQEVRDRDGGLLRAYLTEDGFYRLPASLDEVDRRYLEMLIAYEDRRFWRHGGIDGLALLRAAGQALANGRVVSGASTITMQTARLLEPRPRRLSSKLLEMFRALQLERRYSKQRILSMYLTLAPFGGNLEGVRAAARRYLGRPAHELTAAEAALLVALPQAPSRLRPDRHPDAARFARNKVLEREAVVALLSEAEANRARAEPLHLAVAPLPFSAPHLADRLRDGNAGAPVLRSRLDGPLQRRLEVLVRAEARRLGPRISIALLVVDNENREVLVYVGSSDFADESRDGQVDVVRALRSPGSTLKPALYAMAFDRGIAHPATFVDDVPTQFGDYAPANFMSRHYGRVTLAEALQLSLNVPAVALLRRLGPVAFAERLRRDGIDLKVGADDGVPGLAVALGGVGTTLEDLVRVYAALASDGRLRPLRYLESESLPAPRRGLPLIRAAARWYVGEILRAARPPGDLLPDAYRKSRRGIAFKTGTSYGFRDAWSIGYDAAHTVGVWVGRPDGTSNPGHFGANTAAPLLFQVFDHLPAQQVAPPERPPGALPLAPATLPPGLRHLDEERSLGPVLAAGPPPRILFPPDQTVVGLPPPGRALSLEAEGGRRPLTWIVNGRPLSLRRGRWRARWVPDGVGYSEILLVDALGRRARARVRLVGDEGAELP